MEYREMQHATNTATVGANIAVSAVAREEANDD